jgi:hypothetical protein
MIKNFLKSSMALLCAVGLTLGSCKKDSAIIPEASSDGSPELTTSALETTANLSTASLSPGFTLGINGHPLGDVAYLGTPAADQINLIKKMGMGIYRLNLMTKTDGTCTVPTVLQPLLDAAKAGGVTLLPMLYTKTLDYNDTEANAYTKGKIVGGNFAAKYASVFKYYDMGNDLELPILNSGKDGRVTEDYDQKKLRVTASYLKGMNDGIHANDPDAQTMISAGWVHWGFIKFCQNYGVDFDVLAYHWYSDMEAAIANAKSLNITDITVTLNGLFPGKPIWITEVNLRPGNMSVFEADQNSFLTKFIAKCKANPTVKAVLIYELFDEPYKSAAERYYGIAKWATPYTKWINRLAGDNFIKLTAGGLPTTPQTPVTSPTVPVTNELVTNLTTATGTKPQLTKLILGANYYTDRDYRITAAPGSILNASLIKTAISDKASTLNSYLSFKLNRASTVYIAYDPRLGTLPTWLQSWTKVADKVGITDPDIKSMNLYAKDYNAGTVTLGGNRSSLATGAFCQYFVILKEK